MYSRQPVRELTLIQLLQLSTGRTLIKMHCSPIISINEGIPLLATTSKIKSSDREPKREKLTAEKKTLEPQRNQAPNHHAQSINYRLQQQCTVDARRSGFVRKSN